MSQEVRSWRVAVRRALPRRLAHQIAGMKDVGSAQQQIQNGRAENVRGMQRGEARDSRRERQRRMFVIQARPHP